jgi:hypothetical protein
MEFAVSWDNLRRERPMTAVAPRSPAILDAVLTPTSTAAPANGRGSAATVGSCLATIHSQWLSEVSYTVLPACDPRSGFWFRWGAVRYLADRFDRDYALEVELLDAVIGQVEPQAAQRLREGRRALEILRRDMDWVGRRRGTGFATAAIAGAFLQTLRSWCAELERALSSLPLEEAPYAAAPLARLDRWLGDW